MALRYSLVRLNLTRTWRACVSPSSTSHHPVLVARHIFHAANDRSSSSVPAQPSIWSRFQSNSAASDRSHDVALTDDSQPTEAIIAHSEQPLTAQVVSETAADYIQAFHETISLDVLPWAATIPLAAVAMRLISFPFVYFNQIHMGRFMLASKEFPRIQYFVRHTPGTLFQKYVTFRRLRNLALQSAGTSSLKMFRWHMIVHLPLVIAASMGMRELAGRVPEEWQTSGFGWISDLTAADPMGIMPVVTTGLWLWNLDPKSTPSARDNSSSEKQNANFEKIISGAGVTLARMFQVVSVVSLSVTTELPVGIVLFWFSNGVMTGVQRYALSNDMMRRAMGLVTSEDVRNTPGPAVMQSTGMAVERIREELSYVQREVLSLFKDRRVDEKLCKDVNKLLSRERWSGRISVDLQAVVREDDENGKKYVAIVRSGTAK